MGLLGRPSWRTGAVLVAVALTASALATTATGSAQASPSAAKASPERTPYKAAYTVNLATDDKGFAWAGTEKVTFSNAAADPLTEVYLRLWDNWRGGCSASQPVRIANLTGGTLAPLSVNCTAAKITLPAPLGKDQSATISFTLSITAPNISDRFGRNGAYSYFGNALPVLAVRDGAGWHLDPYADTGESFYALSSDYSVTLDHPAALKVPATGPRQDVPGSAGRRLTISTSKQVREFAWAAGPYSKSTTTTAGGVNVVTYWTGSVSAGTAASMQTVSAQALDSYSRSYGAYPYGEMDVVLDGTFPFGGMEYPGLVFDVPQASAAAHEIGHQWWYGIVGNDEYRAPWLDESFTVYATDRFFGDSGTGCSISWANAGEKVTDTMAYFDSHGDRYSAIVYGYGACTLHDLRRVLGEPAMQKLLADYARVHWYGVSTTADFKAAAQRAASALPTPVDLTAFWRNHRVEG